MGQQKGQRGQPSAGDEGAGADSRGHEDQSDDENKEHETEDEARAAETMKTEDQEHDEFHSFTINDCCEKFLFYLSVTLFLLPGAWGWWGQHMGDWSNSIITIITILSPLS